MTRYDSMDIAELEHSFGQAVMRDYGATFYSFLTGASRAQVFAHGSDSAAALEALIKRMPNDWQRVRAQAVNEATADARERIEKLKTYADALRNKESADMVARAEALSTIEQLERENIDTHTVRGVSHATLVARIDNLDRHISYLKKYYVDTPARSEAAGLERRSREAVSNGSRNDSSDDRKKQPPVGRCSRRRIICDRSSNVFGYDVVDISLDALEESLMSALPLAPAEPLQAMTLRR